MGALTAAVIDRPALPGLFGTGQDGLPVVDGLDRYLGALLGGRACLDDGTCCTVFTEDVVARAGDDDGPTRNGVAGSCEAMIQGIPLAFHDALLALDARGTTRHDHQLPRLEIDGQHASLGTDRPGQPQGEVAHAAPTSATRSPGRTNGATTRTGSWTSRRSGLSNVYVSHQGQT